MRGQSFGGHALTDVSTAGGSAALLLGMTPLVGFVGGGVIGAGAMELHRRRSGSADGTWRRASCSVPRLGLAALFLYLDTTAGATTGATRQILFGSIFTDRTLDGPGRRGLQRRCARRRRGALPAAAAELAQRRTGRGARGVPVRAGRARCSWWPWPWPSGCPRSPSARSCRRPCSSARRPPRCASPSGSARPWDRGADRGRHHLARGPPRLRQLLLGLGQSTAAGQLLHRRRLVFSVLPGAAGLAGAAVPMPVRRLERARESDGRASARRTVFSGFMMNAWVVGHHRRRRRRRRRVLRGPARLGLCRPRHPQRRLRRCGRCQPHRAEPPRRAWASSPLLAALGIGSLGAGRHDVVTALALVMMLALGALFLSLQHRVRASRSTRCSSARSSA